MTRKDYEQVANAVGSGLLEMLPSSMNMETYTSAVIVFADTMCVTLEVTNEKFNRKKFIDAVRKAAKAL